MLAHRMHVSGTDEPGSASVEDTRSRNRPLARFPASETYGSVLWPKDRLIVHSGDRPWQNLYVSLLKKEPWKATLPVIDHHCLAYCVSQSARITRAVDGDVPIKATLGPRSFGIIPASVQSHWDVAGSPEVLLIYIRKSLFDHVAADVFSSYNDRVEIIPGTFDGLLEQLALAVLTDLRRRDHGDSLYSDTMATAMAAQLLQSHSARSKPSAAPSRSESLMPRPGLKRAIDYIDAFLGEPLGIEEVAKIAGLNPIYFARAFRQVLGVSPHQYVLERRIERAKSLLSTTDTLLVDVALETGFSSQSHFSTTFKRIVGVTPGGFRGA